MAAAEVNQVDVTIFGQTYTLTSRHDVETLREVAELVDTRMREVADEMSTITPARVAILASLNIASELLEARSRAAEESSAFQRVVEDLIRLIDRAVLGWSESSLPSGGVSDGVPESRL
jgi:cell division protein ZapA (FtsZ GTPase activity inhibitor)